MGIPREKDQTVEVFIVKRSPFSQVAGVTQLATLDPGTLPPQIR